MGKRKRHQPQDVKAYLSYLTKSRYLGIPKSDTVFKWYFDVLIKNNVDPFDVFPADPEYGEGGSVVFPEDWE
jgi:hypothetical protein